MNEKLTAHFSLFELYRSDVALRHGIDNRPTAQSIANLTQLARNILEPVRAHFNMAFSPSSGYRSAVLNQLIGSKSTSQHILGQAADFEISALPNEDLAQWIKDNLIFDQLILEFYDPQNAHGGWVHCSYVASNIIGENRQMSLIFDGAKYREF